MLSHLTPIYLKKKKIKNNQGVDGSQLVRVQTKNMVKNVKCKMKFET